MRKNRFPSARAARIAFIAALALAGGGVGAADIATASASTSGAHVTGTVLRSTGGPAVNVEVDLMSLSNDFIDFADTDANGFYDIDNVAPGTYRIEFRP